MDDDYIIKTYFNHDVLPVWKSNVRTLAKVLVKVCYIAVTATAFTLSDAVLYGKFRNYGPEWARWAGSEMPRRYDYAVRDSPKPGDLLLPSMGFCDIHESSIDLKVTFTNKNKFICELSPHILYQYVFVVMWFVFVLGIAIAVAGLVLELFHLFLNIFWFRVRKNSLRNLNLRELDYLYFMRRHNVGSYAEVLKLLTTGGGGMEMKHMGGQHEYLVNG